MKTDAKATNGNEQAVSAPDRLPRIIRPTEMLQLLGGISDMTLYRCVMNDRTPTPLFGHGNRPRPDKQAFLEDYRALDLPIRNAFGPLLKFVNAFHKLAPEERVRFRSLATALLAEQTAAERPRARSSIWPSIGLTAGYKID